MIENDDITFDTNFGERKTNSIIKVIGVGGAGNNAVQHMYNEGIKGVDFLICNTDRTALENNAVPSKLVLGDDGLGAGGDPENAKALATSSTDKIRALIGEETKMLFVTAGMGKGTGTGASPVVAQIAHDMGILTIGVVTYPYELEGPVSFRKADAGIEEIKKHVDSLIIIQNEKIMVEYEDKPIRVALGFADDILKNAVQCIAELITKNAYQNVDFKDVLNVMKDSGEAMIGLAEASGDNRIEEVVSQAMTCPLIDDNNITNAKNFLFFLNYGEDQELTVGELKKLSKEIKMYQGPDTNVIWGHGVDKSLGDKIKLSIIVTGYSKEIKPNLDDIFKNSGTFGNADNTQSLTSKDPFEHKIPAAPVDKAEGTQSVFDFHVGEQAPASTPTPTPTNTPAQSQQPMSQPTTSQLSIDTIFAQPVVNQSVAPKIEHPQPAPVPAEAGIRVVNSGVNPTYDNDSSFQNFVNTPAYLRDENNPTLQQQRVEELKKQGTATPTPIYASSFLFGSTPAAD